MKYTEKIIDQFLILYQQGHSYDAIGNEIGVTKNQCTYLYNRYIHNKSGIKRSVHLQKVGENHNHAKVSDEIIIEMFRASESGMKNKEIAKKFGVKYVTMLNIFSGVTRKDNEIVNKLRLEYKIRTQKPAPKTPAKRKGLKDKNLIEILVNAIGNPNFSAEDVEKALYEKIAEIQSSGGNAGSLLALINILPEIDRECKVRY